MQVLFPTSGRYSQIQIFLSGLHSGAVTAGVLRGDRSRFQLFGDTVNTASVRKSFALNVFVEFFFSVLTFSQRMESTGMKGRIQVSEETAELLRQAGKHSWLKTRADRVLAKGKGEFQTYFVEIKSSTSTSSESSNEESDASVAVEKEDEMFFMEEETRFDAQVDRLAKWNAEVLCKILKQIIARRMSKGLKTPSETIEYHKQSKFPLDEVREIIVLPTFDRNAVTKNVDPSTIQLDPVVEAQVLDLVMVIARTYNKNPFHNFKVCRVV